jgi:hypothetical protein
MNACFHAGAASFNMNTYWFAFSFHQRARLPYGTLRLNVTSG